MKYPQVRIKKKKESHKHSVIVLISFFEIIIKIFPVHLMKNKRMLLKLIGAESDRITINKTA